jgi:hypothetical protein
MRKGILTSIIAIGLASPLLAQGLSSGLSTTNPPPIATAGSAAPTGGTLAMGSDGTNAQPLSTNSSGQLIVTTGSGATSAQIQGNVASGATDAGNPVKVGGIFNTTLPTFTNAQRGDVQLDTRGGIFIVIKGPNSTATAAVNSPGDASGNVGSVIAYAQGGVFNGTTWDRNRSTAAAVATTGLGVPAAGIMGRFDTSLPTYTNGQYGVAEINSNGLLQVAVTNAALPSGTDRSGTATTSATTPIAANAARIGLAIQNTGSNIIWYNETGGAAAANAAGSFQITPGSTINIRTNRAVSIIAVTSSTTFSATEW